MTNVKSSRNDVKEVLQNFYLLLLFRQVFHLSGDAEGAIATIVLAMETDIEQRIIVPIRDMVEVSNLLHPMSMLMCISMWVYIYVCMWPPDLTAAALSKVGSQCQT